MGQPILAAAGFQPALFLRCSVRLCTLFCLAAALFAQPAAEWIRSPEPLKQAWGAHVIAEQKLTALVPELLRVIESPETSIDADAAKFAALDTLIQLSAEVPLRDLEPLADRFPTDVLIVAARSHEDASDLLLKLLDRQHNQAAFVAIGNLLTPKRIPGFAKAAMKEFCQHATVWIYNPGQPQGRGSAWAGDTVGKIDTPRAAWPDTGSYLIGGGGDRMRGWIPLVDGPLAVSFFRRANKGYVDHGFDDLFSEQRQQSLYPRRRVSGDVSGDHAAAIACPRRRQART